MLDGVTITGSGVAALCCAALLSRRGIGVRLRPVRRPAIPVLAIDDDTLQLLRSIFDHPLPMAATAYTKARVVDWSDGEAPAELQHHLHVVEERELLRALREALPPLQGGGVTQIVATGGLPTRRYRFGRRRMTGGALVQVKKGDAAYMTAGEKGWEFSLPWHDGKRWVQTAASGSRAGVAIAPALRWPLYGKDWFACGSAAMTMDPVCGDGVGYASRSAIWLCDLLTDLGPNAAGPFYAARLALAFRAHLAACLALYSRARFAQHWEGELAATERGLAAMDQLL